MISDFGLRISDLARDGLSEAVNPNSEIRNKITEKPWVKT